MPKVRNLKHLKDKTCIAIETVTPQRLSLVWEEAEYRLNICSAIDGAHIDIDQMSYSPGEIIVFF
jgi:hypothetical protein